MQVEDYINTVGKQHKNGNQGYEFRYISTLREFIDGAIENCAIPDIMPSALKLAGKLALAARLVTTANAKDISKRIEDMEAALDAYDNEIMSMSNEA